MRKPTLLAALTLLAFPAASLADWGAVAKGLGKARLPARVAAPAGRALAAPVGSVLPVPRGGRALLAPAPPRGDFYRPAPRVRYGASAFVLGVDPVPFWLGWSWGWGYYPLWPRPYYEGGQPGYLPDDARRLGARLEAYGAGASHAAAGTLALAMEGPIAGFNADVTGLALSDPSGATTDAALTIASGRATWSIASEAAFRLRLELGATMVSVPSSGIYASTSYANSVSVGPQLGVSGHVGLVGPFGLEGHARVTPYPVPVVDAKAAVVLRGGPLAVSAGWRSVDVNGNRIDAPEAHFKGPEVGLQLMF
jgi:hypothetical protein